ncbi:MAG TPA: cytochrome c [Anaerolineae bacterium]|nr:cytochrome c [Anaerolineae bacterium]
MNRYYLLTLIALLVLVAALPIYALVEPTRLVEAGSAQEQRFLAQGVATYVSSCAACHGRLGEGVGSMPPLNNAALADADRAVLYSTIAHPPHGTAMSSWHVDDGGSLNTYQVESLVTLIQNADWVPVAALADRQGFVVPTPDVPEVRLATMEGSSEDPHECRACHEEPAMHAERFGLNCARCHTLDAWKPAYLTRHTFLLDHGDEGQIACQTCHTTTYAAYTCYGCHDHTPDDMRLAHEREEITRLEPCGECHPTGAADEAAALGYGLSGGHRREPFLPAPDALPGEPIPDLDGDQDGPRSVGRH